MGFFSKVWEWMGEHKIATGAIGAGIGYLALSKVAKAAPEPFPGTKETVVQKGGGIVTPTKVIPPPNAHKTGQAFYVTTLDPPPHGNLNARSTNTIDGYGNPTGAIIGYWPKNGAVEMLDPGPGNGMVYVSGPGFQNGEAVTLAAWASSAFLSKRDAVEDILNSMPIEF